MIPALPSDIFTETADVDPDTLANLGPLRPLAGSWQAEKGIDINPKAAGPERRVYIERVDVVPIDPQSNGPQLFYGLRYHTHITTREEAITFHDQVGYWLWEPRTGLVLQSLTIPRGQVALAAGHAAADARSLVLKAERGHTDYGICSTTFLEEAFRTDAYSIEVTFNPDDTWTYATQTVLQVRGRPDPFIHRDGNTLARIAGPRPNPLLQVSKTGARPQA